MARDNQALGIASGFIILAWIASGTFVHEAGHALACVSLGGHIDGGNLVNFIHCDRLPIINSIPVGLFLFWFSGGALASITGLVLLKEVKTQDKLWLIGCYMIIIGGGLNAFVEAFANEFYWMTIIISKNWTIPLVPINPLTLVPIIPAILIVRHKSKRNNLFQIDNSVKKEQVNKD